MSVTVEPIARRHRCQYGAQDHPPTMRCSFWSTGKPTRKRCGNCGGAFVVEEGAWVTGRGYGADDVVSTHRNEAAARRYSDDHRADELVWYFRATR